jgi:phage shock protein PspC (stress-responsive transcriptional regulator)
MVFIWRIGEYGMISDVWLVRIVWIGLPLMSLVVWYYIIKLIMYLINWGI